ncbi:hypothetical protein [Pseudomonas aeruginosa]|uniref:hypothetical protein n=1 Tax=Pseudomonas aeruginosa TaxID=287 RepID=UPI002E3283A8|nr:hypothetical protein [Pseudomonas aeruginosa]
MKARAALRRRQRQPDRVLRARRPGETITILEVGGSAEHIRIDHAEDEAVWQLAIDNVKAGKRVLVANDSARVGQKMAALIEAMVEEAEIKPVRMLLVHADSKADQDVEAIPLQPTPEAIKYDVLIYSPASPRACRWPPRTTTPTSACSAVTRSARPTPCRCCAATAPPATT